ncbi:hypothetical protein ABTL77_20170, partial [Acinetobacter baumannii]
MEGIHCNAPKGLLRAVGTGWEAVDALDEVSAAGRAGDPDTMAEVVCAPCTPPAPPLATTGVTDFGRAATAR